jgi:hypothetical protein
MAIKKISRIFNDYSNLLYESKVSPTQIKIYDRKQIKAFFWTPGKVWSFGFDRADSDIVVCLVMLVICEELPEIIDYLCWSNAYNEWWDANKQSENYGVDINKVATKIRAIRHT